MEGTVNFGPNVVILLAILGARIWYIVGAYVPPTNVPEVHRVEQALAVAPKGAEIILMGDLNVSLQESRDERKDELTTALADHDLENTTFHFTP